MKKTVKTTALIAVLTIWVSLLAACRINIQFPAISANVSATTEAPSVSVSSSQPTTQAPSQSVTDNTAQPTAAAPSENTSAAPQQEVPTAGVQTSPLEMNNEQLLNYFNTAVNRMKTAKPGYTKGKLTSILDLQLSNSAANTLVGLVKSSLLSETEDKTTVNKGESGDAVLSPSGAAYVSALTTSDIKAISVEQTSGGYSITLTLPDAVNPAKSGSAYAKIFDFMTVDDVVAIYAPKVGATVAREDIEVAFSNCCAKAQIDTNGNVTGYETDVTAEMRMNNASIKKVVTIKTDLTVTLLSVTKYTGISY